MNSLETRLREAREEMNARLEDAQLENARKRKKLIDEKFSNLARKFPEWSTTWQVFRNQETEILEIEHELLIRPTRRQLLLSVEAQWKCFHSKAAIFYKLQEDHPERKEFASTLRNHREMEAKQREIEYLSFWLTADWLERREKKILEEAARINGRVLCVSVWLEEVLDVRREVTLPLMPLKLTR